MKIVGSSLLGFGTAEANAANGFWAFNPGTGEQLEPRFHSATASDVERAGTLAREAFAFTRNLSGLEKAAFLRSIAGKLEAAKATIVERANLETALPVARLEGEVGRTVGQLRLFAQLVEAGSWVDARVDPGNPNRMPLPKPDVRSMLRPLGPVAVFGASNFPLAFSVAGGDTASALAAGCPVIVKAHSAHPGTSELVGRLITEAVRECGLPEGTFSLLFDAGHEVGLSLVRHADVKAVGFTGSRSGGLALLQAAQSRPEPIPVFAEMSSINPVVISPGALQQRSSVIAEGLQAAVTLGVGQFCTNPGLVFLPVGEQGDAFLSELATLMGAATPGTMLTAGICEAYHAGSAALQQNRAVQTHVWATPQPGIANAALFETSVEALRESPELLAEVFGPTTLVARYKDAAELERVIGEMEGQLTATLHLEAEEIGAHTGVMAALEARVGRLILNGFPTGVEVGPAMVHGGPFPATSDGRSTSVGTQAIFRFVRPVCYQNFPDEALPLELQNANPLGIARLVEGQNTTAPVA